MLHGLWGEDGTVQGLLELAGIPYAVSYTHLQVLADMTRTGILVDRDGIEAFGVQLRQELDQVLTRIRCV